MHVSTFNRSPIISKHQAAKAAERRKAGLSKSGRAEDGRRSAALSDFEFSGDGTLDPGFEDMGIMVTDVEVVPGVMGHFSTSGDPVLKLFGYYPMKTLERIQSAA